jgi:glutaminyl-peptide cyclotransferase
MRRPMRTLAERRPSCLRLLFLGALTACSLLATCCNGQPRQPGGESHPAESQPAEGEQFDAVRAWTNLTKQCDFGPRVPGTQAHEQCGDWLLAQLKETCDVTIEQEFTHRSTRMSPGKSFDMRNLIGVIEPAEGSWQETRQVLLVAHWDSRPIADQDRDPAKRTQPVPGANDGASGVAVALEIARCLSIDPAPVTVIVLLTDGEDFGTSGDPTLSEWFLGAREFARDPRGLDPKRGILLDMVGDKGLRIGREMQSYLVDPSLVQRIWAIAGRLGRDDMFVNTEYAVSDDHEPLIRAGIPVVDLIDWRSEVTHTYWHTVADTPDKCSAESLDAVGDVVLAVLREGI